MAMYEAGYGIKKVETLTINTAPVEYDFKGATLYFHVMSGGAVYLTPEGSADGWMINKDEKEGHFSINKIKISASQDGTKLRVMYIEGV